MKGIRAPPGTWRGRSGCPSAGAPTPGPGGPGISVFVPSLFDKLSYFIGGPGHFCEYSGLTVR